MEFYATNADSVNINCISSGGYACAYSDFYAEYANQVNIELFEQYGSSQSEYYLNNAGSITFNARGNDCYVQYLYFLILVHTKNNDINRCQSF